GQHRISNFILSKDDLISREVIPIEHSPFTQKLANEFPEIFVARNKDYKNLAGLESGNTSPDGIPHFEIDPNGPSTFQRVFNPIVGLPMLDLHRSVKEQVLQFRFDSFPHYIPTNLYQASFPTSNTRALTYDISSMNMFIDGAEVTST